MREHGHVTNHLFACVQTLENCCPCVHFTTVCPGLVDLAFACTCAIEHVPTLDACMHAWIKVDACATAYRSSLCMLFAGSYHADSAVKVAPGLAPDFLLEVAPCRLNQYHTPSPEGHNFRSGRPNESPLQVHSTTRSYHIKILIDTTTGGVVI